MSDTNWVCKSNVCYGCDHFLPSRDIYYDRCRKSAGHMLSSVPEDCPRLTKFEEQYDMPCKCGKVGVAYPIDYSDIHIFCKHCGWGVDEDGQPSYYVNVDSISFYPFMCGQLLSRTHRKGVPFSIPKRCHCGGIPVIKFSNPNWMQDADPDYYVQCNTCNLRRFLHSYYGSSRPPWDELMASKKSEKNPAQPERRLSNDKKAGSLERQARKYKGQVKQLKDEVSTLAEENKKLVEEKADRKKEVVIKMPRRIIRRRGVN